MNSIPLSSEKKFEERYALERFDAQLKNVVDGYTSRVSNYEDHTRKLEHAEDSNRQFMFTSVSLSDCYEVRWQHHSQDLEARKLPKITEEKNVYFKNQASIHTKRERLRTFSYLDIFDKSIDAALGLYDQLGRKARKAQTLQIAAALDSFMIPLNIWPNVGNYMNWSVNDAKMTLFTKSIRDLVDDLPRMEAVALPEKWAPTNRSPVFKLADLKPEFFANDLFWELTPNQCFTLYTNLATELSKARDIVRMGSPSRTVSRADIANHNILPEKVGEITQSDQDQSLWGARLFRQTYIKLSDMREEAPKSVPVGVGFIAW